MYMSVMDKAAQTCENFKRYRESYKLPQSYTTLYTDILKREIPKEFRKPKVDPPSESTSETSETTKKKVTPLSIGRLLV